MKNKLTSVNRNSFESELTCVIKGSSVMNVSAAEEECTLRSVFITPSEPIFWLTHCKESISL